LVAAACGGSDDDGGGAASEPAATEAAEIVVEAEEQPVSAEAAPDDTAAGESDGGDAAEPATTEAPPVEEEVAAPAGELRVASFGPVTSYNPAAVNSAQFGYLIPVYDTLTRQNADLQVMPGLATAWTRPEPNIWEFTVRDDVVFHDGAAFDAFVQP
jgi:peptide/nickel transport system substrate-binding protein